MRRGSLIAFMLLAGVSLQADTTQNSKEELLNKLIENQKILMENQKQLQKEIENERTKIRDLASSSEEKDAEVWDVLDKVETKTFSDKLNWSIDMRYRVDDFKYQMNGIGDRIGQVPPSDATSAQKREYAFPIEKNWKPQHSVRGYFNLTSEFLDNAKFTGRMKFDHSSQGDERICILSPQSAGHNLSASDKIKFTTFEVDRAFFDVYFNQKGSVPFIFTAGILPTSGGMSSNIIENTPRKSVFPSLIFDSNTYGAILTANFSRVIAEETYLRAVYGKAHTLNDDSYAYQCNRATVQDMDIAGLFIETKLPLSGIDNTFWAGYNQNSNLKLHPFLGGTSSESSGSNTKISSMQELGDIANYGLGFEFRNLKLGEAGGVSIFAHYAISNPNPNGNCVNYTGTDMDCAVGGKANPSPYYDSEMARGTLIDEKGYSIYAGFQYSFPFWGTRFGYEYNKGDKYWWSATQGSEDMFNKLATRGNAHEVYLIQPITKSIYARVGYLRIKELFTGSGWHFGTPLAKDGLQQDLYLLINAYF